MLSDMANTRASLQSRLILRLCAVFVAFFVVAGMVVFLVYHTDSQEIPFDVLADDLHALKTAVTVENGGHVKVDETKLSPSIGYMVRTLDGTVKLSGGRHADELQAIETPALDEVTESCRLAGKERPQRERPRNRQCSLSELLEINGDTLVMQVTRRISPTSTALDALFYEWLGEYLPVTLPMLLALITAMIFTLRSAMKPLER
jgi:hypothetical protein